MEIEMKKIENFGGWVVEHWLGFSCAALIALALVLMPRGVTLTEKEFKCIAASPNGLTTRCDLYERRVK
jgi:hypothetical protein